MRYLVVLLVASSAFGSWDMTPPWIGESDGAVHVAFFDWDTETNLAGIFSPESGWSWAGDASASSAAAAVTGGTMTAGGNTLTADETAFATSTLGGGTASMRAGEYVVSHGGSAGGYASYEASLPSDLFAPVEWSAWGGPLVQVLGAMLLVCLGFYLAGVITRAGVRFITRGIGRMGPQISQSPRFGGSRFSGSKSRVGVGVPAGIAAGRRARNIVKRQCRRGGRWSRAGVQLGRLRGYGRSRKSRRKWFRRHGLAAV